MERIDQGVVCFLVYHLGGRHIHWVLQDTGESPTIHTL